MKKIINPCMCEVYENTLANAFVKIVYENKKLSITGVIGPMKNGDCKGSAGQCVDEIRKGTPVANWTSEMLNKLCNIWDEWHLNDMRPYCEHQKELHWNELAKEKIDLHHYIINDEASKMKREAENEALNALKKGETFNPTIEQTLYASLSYGLDIYGEVNENLIKYYKPCNSILGKPAIETKTLGWVTQEEHPNGILSRPCPVCGYKYGHEWKFEEVPKEVIEWLFNLPSSSRTPAWI